MSCPVLVEIGFFIGIGAFLGACLGFSTYLAVLILDWFFRLGV